MKPVLAEMDIEDKGRFNLETFHKGEAGTVCKGKVFIIIFAKDLPAHFPVSRSNRLDYKKDIGLEGITKFNCGFTAYGFRKEIKGFNKNKLDVTRWFL